MGREGEVVDRAAARVRAHASRHPRRGPAAAVDRRAREAADRVRRRRHARRLPARQHLDSGVRRARRARAARRTRRRVAGRSTPRDYFPGIWDTNVVDGKLLRRAVVRRHAAPVLPPRPARAAPATRRRRARGRNGRRCSPRSSSDAGRRSLRDPAAAQRVRAAARARAAAGRPAAARRRPLGQFPQRGLPPRAATSTSTCSAAASRRRSTNADISNVWNEFGRGYFAFYISGPWNIGEFKRRLPAERAGELDDGAAARARRARRVDRRRLEPRRLPRSRNKAAAWQLIEYPVATRRAAALPRADRRSAAAAQRVARRRARRRRLRARVSRPARARQADAQGAGVGAHRQPRCGSSPSASCTAT